MERLGLVDAPGRPRIALGAAAGRWVTVCLTAPDKAADAAGQTAQVLEIIEGYLIEAGSAKDRVLMAQVWLKRMTDHGAFCAVWNRWIDATAPPALSVVRADASREASLVEIRVYAAR